MRKLIIIGMMLLFAVWLLLMPALVGIYLRESVPTWLAEWSEPDETAYRPGWFGSKLHWQPGTDLGLVLSARHFPPFKPGWVALEGELDSPLTPRAAGIRGHLGLTGSWYLNATAAQFRLQPHDGPVAHQLSLNVSQVAGQPLSLVANADRIELSGLAPPLLDLRARGLRTEHENGRITLGLDMQADSRELGSAALTLRAGPVDPAQLELLIQGLGQLAESSPGSMTEGMALMTLAGAWQVMASDGLVIELERLELGKETRFQGRWHAGQSNPMITGTGDLDELDQWLRRFAPQALSDDLTEVLAGLGQLDLEDRRFRFSFRPRPGSGAPGSDPRQAP